MNPAGAKLKIIHVDTATELRGGQRQLLLLAAGLRRRGHEQLIVCPAKSKLATRTEEEGFACLLLPAHGLAHARGTLLLRSKLIHHPFQLIHAHDGRGQTMAWLASLGMNVRRVASRRVAFLPRRVWLHRIQYQRACHAVIAVSQFVRELLIESGVADSKITVIPDGIEIPETLPTEEQRTKIRRKWGYGQEEFLVGHVGAFTLEKGQDVAIEAALHLKKKLPQTRLVLAGNGPLWSSSSVRNMVKAAQGRVQLLDEVENLAEFFAGLDLFVMPSRAEGLGSSALLAMAYGLPVIASKVGGLPEIVQEGKTGWLVPPDSPSALAEAIASACVDGECRVYFGSNARRQAQDFSSNIMIERTESLYYRLCNT